MTYKTLKKRAAKRNFKISLGPLHDAWIEYAAQIGKKPSTAMADLARRELQRVKPDSQAWVPDPTPCAERKTPLIVHITLTASELQALTEKAADLGMSRPRYLTYLTRIAATQKPLLNKDEHRLLNQYLADFRRVGSNLNQIARALNTFNKGGEALGVDSLSDDLADLRKQLEKLTPLLREKTSAVFSRAPLRKRLDV